VKSQWSPFRLISSEVRALNCTWANGARLPRSGGPQKVTSGSNFKTVTAGFKKYTQDATKVRPLEAKARKTSGGMSA
jgi:hypothetical protein